MPECYAPDKLWERAKKIHTNTYVWGEGFQVDSSQEFSNFTPKNIRNFKGTETPDVVDVAFGWYHEAYIDTKGNLYVCAKAKMPSIKIKEVPDNERKPLVHVTTLPKGSKVHQVTFTRQRMFVLTKDGKLYVFRIEEKAPSREDQILGGMRAQYTGEMVLEKPIFVKDLPQLK